MAGQDKTTTRGWGAAMRPLKESVIPNVTDAYRAGESPLGPQSAESLQANRLITNLATMGNPNADTIGQLQGMVHQGTSPEFMSALDTQAGKLGTDISRQFGTLGRGGSVAHQNALVDSVGNLRTSAMANELARQQGVNLGILGQIGGLQQQGYANQAGGAGMLSNVGQQQNARAAAESPYGLGAAYGGLLGNMAGLSQTQTTSTDPTGQIMGLIAAGGQAALGMPPTALGGLGGSPQATGAPMPINGMYGGMSPYFGTGSGLY